jgi:hypothetical protein
MDIVNFPGMIANGQATTDPNKIDPDKDLIVVGKKVSKSREGNQYQEIAVPIDTLMTFAKPPYKVYTALLSQLGTAAPTALVLENTIGDIVWSYDGVGKYSGTLNGAFPNEDKFFTLNYKNMVDQQTFIAVKWKDANTFSVTTAFVTYTPVVGSTLQNSMMSNYPIEIRVYN